jgi:5'-nucleotidase
MYLSLFQSRLCADCGLAREAIELIKAAGLRGGQVASVTIPPLLPEEEPTGIRIVRQCTRGWEDTYEERRDPRGRLYFWNSSVFMLGNTVEDTDVAGLRDEWITPLQFDLTHYPMLHEWQSKEWRLK